MLRLDLSTPFGIPNEGNTCYINSVLQCLLSNKDFVSLALEHHQVQQCSSSGIDDNLPFCALCEIASMVLSGLTGEARGIMFKNQVNCLSNTLSAGRQEDAHELLLGILNNIDMARGTEAITSLFTGNITSEVECLNCGGVSGRLDNMVDLSLEIKEHVVASLATFFKDEILSGAHSYKCSRYRNGMPTKDARAITIQQRITNKSLQVCFDLFGVVCHKGNLATSGHYVAYVKRDGWFLVDDQNGINTYNAILARKFDKMGQSVHIFNSFFFPRWEKFHTSSPERVLQSLCK
ncbi:unnamed protein product, partial [Porites lobata]